MSLPQRIYSQVPEFVRTDHPAFLEFIKAYYTWLSTEYSPNKIEDVVDIDNTVAEFLQYFKKELDINGILTGVDNRTYLRHIKELYAAKGSSSGFEFLFKILYGAKSSIQHPWDYVFKPSNGEWFQDISILVTPTVGDINGLLGNPVIITDDAGVKYQTVVTNINTRRNGVVELFIGRFTHEAPLYSVQSLTGDIAAVLLLTTTKAIVEKRGSGFRIGQVYKINAYGGSGSLAKIKAVDTNGGVTAIEIIGFGTGYLADFNLLISPIDIVDPKTLGARITLSGLTYKTDDAINVQNEGGSIVAHNYTNLNTSYLNDPSYVGQTVGVIQSQPGINYVTDNYASVKFTSGHVCIYPGYYRSSNNIIGDLVYIEDSFYYQAFSYVTVLEKKLEEYSDLLRRTLHPAGTKHFGIYEIFDDLQLSLTVDPSLNLISRADALRDFFQTVEQIIFFLEVVYADTATATELFDRTLTAFRAFTDDTFTNDDTKYFNVSGVYSDSITNTESFDRVWSATTFPVDSITSTESFDRVWDAATSLADSTSNSDLFDRVWDAATSLADSTTAITESFDRVWNASTSATDSVTVTELIEIIPGISIDDVIAISSADPSFTVDKYIVGDTAVVTTSGALYMEPYYVEVTPNSYWQAGYLENEREFTN